MITKLEVDGFKNLTSFSIDFGPYTCIAGPNSVGKSNIFDAIRFLSLTAQRSFNEAALELRTEGTPGNITDIFGPSTLGCDLMKISAEMIVSPEQIDDFNRKTKSTSTFLRYELTLRLVRDETEFGIAIPNIVLEEEALKYIIKGEAAQKIPWIKSRDFFDSVISNSRKGQDFIRTVKGEGEDRVEVAQDGTAKNGQGKSRGKPSPIPIGQADTTQSALRAFASFDYPTLFAAKKELESWMLLSLEPSSMRAASSLNDADMVNSRGGNIPKTVFSLMRREGNESFLEKLETSSSGLVDVREIRIEVDERRQSITLMGKIGEDPLLPATSLSDGTLRFLTLCILELDSRATGTICMEEPENGIHPGKMHQMYELITHLAVDPSQVVDDSNPLRQVIVNSHSPAYVAQHDVDVSSILMAESKKFRLPDGEITQTLRVLPVRVSRGRGKVVNRRLGRNWRDLTGGSVTVSNVGEYLNEGVIGSQLALISRGGQSNLRDGD